MARISSKDVERLTGQKLEPSGAHGSKSGTPGRGNKFGARRTEYAGVVFDSKAEADRARTLDLLLAGRQIRGYVRQVRFCLGVPENVYVVDFLVWAPDGSSWAEDVKGHETAKFRRDRKLWAAYGPCPLHLLKGRGGEIIEGVQRGK